MCIDAVHCIIWRTQTMYRGKNRNLKISFQIWFKNQVFQKWEFLILKTGLSRRNLPSSGLSASRPLGRSVAPLRSDRSPSPSAPMTATRLPNARPVPSHPLSHL